MKKLLLDIEAYLEAAFTREPDKADPDLLDRVRIRIAVCEGAEAGAAMLTMTTFVHCAKCGARRNKTLTIESHGEGSEAGRVFYYCSTRCERTH